MALAATMMMTFLRVNLLVIPEKNSITKNFTKFSVFLRMQLMLKLKRLSDRLPLKVTTVTQTEEVMLTNSKFSIKLTRCSLTLTKRKFMINTAKKPLLTAQRRLAEAWAT